MRGKLNLFASLELGSLRVNIYLCPMLIQTGGFFDSRRAFCELRVLLLLPGIYILEVVCFLQIKEGKLHFQGMENMFVPNDKGYTAKSITHFTVCVCDLKTN